MFENVDKQWKDEGVIRILLAHPSAFGSRELTINHRDMNKILMKGTLKLNTTKQQGLYILR